MATLYNGQLHSNEVFGSIYNMIISQYVEADNISSTASKLVDMCRVDGSMYGDTITYYFSDVLATHEWGADDEAGNLLALDRPADPFCQAITLDTFRQIRLTVDNYLSKRAWATEGAFSAFTSVMLGWLGMTKRIYDATTLNTFVGTTVSNEGKQNVSITLPTGDTEADNRMEAQLIAKTVADILTDVSNIGRDYNDLGYMRAYSLDDIIVVWNAEWVNKITKMDMPTLFHKEGLIDKFEQVVLPTNYFGTTFVTTTTATNLSSLVEADANCFPTKETVIGYANGTKKSFFAGERITKPSDTTITSIDGLAEAPVGTFYTNTTADSVICKIIHKKSVPYMSAFEVQTSFLNSRSLTENHYLTFAHNTLQYLADKPFITVRATKK